MGKEKLLKVGDEAPNFTLVNQDGKTVSLSDYKGKKNVVLFFYPKDQTQGCTKEACSFRDNYETITDLGAEVIGINGDGTSSHKAFADKHSLPYHLVSDKGSQVRKAYGVSTMFFILPERITFVIDKQGIIQYVHNEKSDPTDHITKAIEALQKLN